MRPQFCVPWFLIIVSAPELCVPPFFSSQKLAYHYFCNVWEGLICMYHHVCRVFICFFGLFRKEMYENTWFPQDLLKNSPWNVHYGFQSYSSCNFSFSGPGCGPPHKWTSNEHFVQEFAIGIKKSVFSQANCRYAAIRLEKATIFVESDKAWFVRTTIFAVSGAASAKHSQAKHNFSQT